MQINPDKASNTSLPPHGKNNGGLLPWQLQLCWIWIFPVLSTLTELESHLLTHTPKERKKGGGGFEGLIKEGGMD